MAATLCSADLEVSRKFQFPEIEPRIFYLAISANELVTGWRKGRQLGPIKFLASAGEGNGASFTFVGIPRRAWRLDPEAAPARYLQPLKDLKVFRASLHLTAWKLGAWPVLLAWAQTTMSSGWIANYLYSSCRAPPEKCEFHLDKEKSSSDNEEAEAKKRKLGEADPEDSGLRK